MWIERPPAFSVFGDRIPQGKSRKKISAVASVTLPSSRFARERGTCHAANADGSTYKQREWMLTESGFDQALALCKIPPAEKQHLPTKSYEVQKIVKKLLRSHVPDKYSPFDTTKRFTILLQNLCCEPEASAKQSWRPMDTNALSAD
jgi:hypothetical protein